MLLIGNIHGPSLHSLTTINKKEKFKEKIKKFLKNEHKKPTTNKKPKVTMASETSNTMYTMECTNAHKQFVAR